MQRRSLILAAAATTGLSLTALPRAARAHHGWSNFDGQRPLYLEGTLVEASWGNPHASVVLEPAGGLRLPADLKQRAIPAQQAAVDAPAILAATTVPTRRAERWTLELAPLSRMQAWQVQPLKVGDRIALVGYAAPGESGPATMRVEFLFVGDKAYGLRSSPAS